MNLRHRFDLLDEDRYFPEDIAFTKKTSKKKYAAKYEDHDWGNSHHHKHSTKFSRRQFENL